LKYKFSTEFKEQVFIHILEIYQIVLNILIFFHQSTEKLIEEKPHSILSYTTHHVCDLLFFANLLTPTLRRFCKWNSNRTHTYHYNSNRTYTYKHSISLLERKTNYIQSFPSYAALRICGLFKAVHYKDCLAKIFREYLLNTSFWSKHSLIWSVFKTEHIDAGSLEQDFMKSW